MKKSIIITTAFYLFTSFCSVNTHAIPAFARKYSISCKTCHTPSTPKLKPYGDDFAGDGFRLADNEAPRYFIDTGDPELSLIRDFPLAVRLEGFFTYNSADDDKPDFGLPFNLKILSGGQLSEHLSYYFYFYLSELGEVAGVEDAFLMYNNLFKSELDIYLGQFQVCDPLFKRETRLSLEDYTLYTSQIGISDIKLKYDKGIMMTYGFSTGTDLVVEIVNGNGLSEADAWKVFDKDQYKNVAGRISQDIGEYFRIGIFGYHGNEELVNFESNTIKNSVLFQGVDASFSYKQKFEINLQYLNRKDEHVYASLESVSPLEDLVTHGYLGEIIFSPKADESKWYALGLLNLVRSDYDPADYSSATLHAGYLLRRNVRLVSEFTWDFTRTDQNYGRASLGFVSAF
jgi:hypothetical protein